MPPHARSKAAPLPSRRNHVRRVTADDRWLAVAKDVGVKSRLQRTILNGSEADSMRLDFSAMLRAVLPPFIVWAAAVLFVSFAGRQPGVVCATPVAWLM